MTDSRLGSGHQPLAEVLGGGLPANGISIIMGLPGTGKTIIAQQYTFHNARPDRPAVYFPTCPSRWRRSSASARPSASLTLPWSASRCSLRI